MTASPQKPLSLNLRVLALAKPEWKVLVLGTFFLAVGSGSSLIYPQLVRQILDQALSAKDMAQVNHVALIIWLAFIVQGIASAIRYYLFTLSGERIVLKLRAQLYSHILNQEVAFFDFHRTGDLMSRLSSDATILQNTVSVNISMALRNIAVGLGGLGLMIYTSPKLALGMLLVIPPVGVSAAYFGKRVRAASKRTQEALAEASNVSEETISGLRTVRSFSQESYEKARYNSALEKSLFAARERISQISWFIGFASIVGFSAVSAVLWYGGKQVVTGELSVGDLMQFLIYLIMVAFSVGALGGLWGDLMAAVGAAKRVFDILDKQPEVDLKAGRRLANVRGEIEFRDVSFVYPARNDIQVLQNLSFSLKPGMTMALVGPSGSGKSSAASLLARFYDPQKGTIFLDGVSLKELEPSWLREQIGVVSQEPVLISSTIEENIRYGNEKASPEQVRKAAEEANAEKFILNFPEKFKTLVGERGIQLSGGQKQRVAIARAILKDPKILILDEATSALDTESEALVQEALQKLMKGRTTLVIAHRLATVREADLILVLEKGQIVETGRHEDLMKRESGVYRKLIERQVVQ